MSAKTHRRPGRPNKGAAHLDRVDADPVTKARAKAILATISGELTVKEACEALSISDTRFEMLREQMLQAAVHGLAPRPPGRPRRHDPADRARLDALEAEVARLHKEMQAKDAALQVVDLLPNVLADMQAAAAGRNGAQKRGRAPKGRTGKKA